jgi:hypothetical protein
MTFLLSEDKALREKLQGIEVEDQKSIADGKARNVGVWFGQPDQEIRNQSYPYITIDMLGITRDTEREMRGIVSPSYLMPETFPANVDGAEMHLPIPVMIDYQITTYARHPRHDRMIIGQLLYTKFPIRFGYLELDDGTIRRLDVQDVAKRDITEQAKRLFVNAITVRVSSEVPLGTLKNLYQVTNITLEDPTLISIVGRPGEPLKYGVFDGEVNIT